MSQRRIDSNSIRMNKIPVQLSVHVCGQTLSLDQFLEWAPGTVLSFNQQSSSSLQLRLGQQNIATGHVVKIGSQLGFQVESVARKSQVEQVEPR